MDEVVGDREKKLIPEKEDVGNKDKWQQGWRGKSSPLKVYDERKQP